MDSSHPLFGSTALADAWAVVGDDRFPDDRLDALTVLVDHRKDLPAPVFFEVPEGAQLEEPWLNLLERSEAACGCYSRRLLMPMHGRSRFVSATQPRLVELRQPKHDEPREQLVIAPHGGDAASAYVALSFWSNELDGQEWPYQGDRPALPMFYGRHKAGDSWGGRMVFDTSTLADLVHRGGEVICSQVLPGRLTVPVCSIVAVGYAPSYTNPAITIELDAAVRRIEHDPSNPPVLHVCAAA